MLAEHLHHTGDPEALPTRMQVNPRLVRLELDRHGEKEQRAKDHARTGVALLHGRPCTPRHSRAHPAVVDATAQRDCGELRRSLSSARTTDTPSPNGAT